MAETTVAGNKRLRAEKCGIKSIEIGLYLIDDRGQEAYMDDLIKALELSVANKNWYGSLFIALSIPDICGYLEFPTKPSQDRYERWFNKYMLPKYTSYVGKDRMPHIFLSASDCYAFRCALLHEGREDIAEQRAREALERFHFIEPPPSGEIHRNQLGNVLQLQVDIFCADVLNGLREWLKNIQNVPDVKQRIGNILKVYPYNKIPGMSIEF